MTKLSLIILSALLLGGCAEQTASPNELAIQACISKGGVPILSWLDIINDCKFPATGNSLQNN